MATKTLPNSADACPERATGGRPRDASRDDALRQAALELIAEIGYDRMTIEAIAARAGAGKATVYRRWATKAELVVDALHRDDIAEVMPDTGSLRGDLLALSTHLFSGHDPLFKARLISGMVSGMLADPGLRQAFDQSVLPPQRALMAIIDRAVARGEITCPADPQLVASVLPALGQYRLIFTGQGPDAALVSTIIDNIILPVLLNGPGPATPPPAPAASRSRTIARSRNRRIRQS